MSDSRSAVDPATRAESLLQGPRGRRLLLEFARASEELRSEEVTDRSFRRAVFDSAFALEPHQGSLYRYVFQESAPQRFRGWITRVRNRLTGRSQAPLVGDITPTPSQPEPPVANPDLVAQRLTELELAPVTDEVLMQCLARSVDTARYWQEPDGEDQLAATPAMRAALHRVADHLSHAADSSWWWSAVPFLGQWAVQFPTQPIFSIPQNPQQMMQAARENLLEAERRAAAQNPRDPGASISGEWWSTPAHKIVDSAREIQGIGPVGLMLVEDSMGEESAECSRLSIRPGLRVYEIDSAQAWAQLCAQFPLEHTAYKRHDWYRTTGRDGRWVIPDWAAVAQHYEAVHLQVGAYLEAAGTVIPVDDETASVIAGWNPDATYWFSPDIGSYEEPVAWILDTSASDERWVRTP